MTSTKTARSLGIVRKFFPDVQKVVDAKSNLTIDLRPSDVRSAKAKKHDGCAMAVACQRQCKTDGAIVSTTTAYLVKGPKATRYFVPQSVAREIVAFDRGAGFPAGEYVLYKPYKAAPKRITARPDPQTYPRAPKRAPRRSPGLRAALSSL